VYEKESARNGRLTFVTVVTEYRRADRQLAAEAIFTVVERQIRGTARAAEQPGSKQSAVVPLPTELRAPITWMSKSSAPEEAQLSRAAGRLFS
jgi:hypothetical protein